MSDNSGFASAKKLRQWAAQQIQQLELQTRENERRERLREALQGLTHPCGFDDQATNKRELWTPAEWTGRFMVAAAALKAEGVDCVPAEWHFIVSIPHRICLHAFDLALHGNRDRLENLLTAVRSNSPDQWGTVDSLCAHEFSFSLEDVKRWFTGDLKPGESYRQSKTPDITEKKSPVSGDAFRPSDPVSPGIAAALIQTDRRREEERRKQHREEQRLARADRGIELKNAIRARLADIGSLPADVDVDRLVLEYRRLAAAFAEYQQFIRHAYPPNVLPETDLDRVKRLADLPQLPDDARLFLAILVAALSNDCQFEDSLRLLVSQRREDLRRALDQCLWYFRDELFRPDNHSSAHRGWHPPSDWTLEQIRYVESALGWGPSFATCGEPSLESLGPSSAEHAAIPPTDETRPQLPADGVCTEIADPIAFLAEARQRSEEAIRRKNEIDEWDCQKFAIRTRLSEVFEAVRGNAPTVDEWQKQTARALADAADAFRAADVVSIVTTPLPTDDEAMRIARAALAAGMNGIEQATQAVELICANEEQRPRVRSCWIDIQRDALKHIDDRNNREREAQFPETKAATQQASTPQAPHAANVLSGAHQPAAAERRPASNEVNTLRDAESEGRYSPWAREPRTFRELLEWMIYWRRFSAPTSHNLEAPAVAYNHDHHYIECYCKSTFGAFDPTTLAKLRDRFLVATNKTVDQIGETTLREIADHFRGLNLVQQATSSEGEGVADGPTPPNIVWWQAKCHELPPRLWQILNHLWSRDNVLLEDLAAAVWGDEGESVADTTVRSRLSELNSRLLEWGIPRNYSLKRGYIRSN